MTSRSDLTGKNAVVTGAASGIGLAMTEAFVAQGMAVVMADIDEPTLVAAAERLESAGAHVTAVLVDVTDFADVRRLADRAESAHGPTYLVCNNAGVAPAGPILTSTADEWRWVFDVNVHGVANGVRAFAPRLVAAGSGHVVNTASEAGLVTTPMLAAYCASKHAVVGLSETLYRELEGTGVGVSCLCPSLVRTAIFESERNAPVGLDLGPGHGATIAPLREIIGVAGIEPSVAAAAVVDAVKANRFWVFTHPDTPGRAVIRHHDIDAGRNPTPTY